MAYNYFSKQLLDSTMNLADVFPDKQKFAKEKQRVSYGLEDIVLYLKDATEDFKFFDPKYIELDNGIREIVKKYYISTNQPNPFEGMYKKDEVPEYKEGEVPKQPFIVDKDKVVGKGITAPKQEIATAPAEVAIPKVTEQNKETELLAKIDKFKRELDNRQMLLDDFVEMNELSEKESLMSTYEKNLEGIATLIEEGFADDFDVKRYELLSEFLQKNK
jgi:hypothetical protein